MSDPTLTVIALLVTGYLLLAVEAFVIPGFGVPGIAGLISLGAGCYLAYQQFDAALGTFTIVLVLSSVTVAMWWLPKTRFGKDVVHSSTLATAKAAETTLEPGDVGVTESDLRPAGVARFGEDRRSVVTEGEFIDTHTRVVITEVRGSRIVVEAAASENALPT